LRRADEISLMIDRNRPFPAATAAADSARSVDVLCEAAAGDDSIKQALRFRLCLDAAAAAARTNRPRGIISFKGQPGKSVTAVFAQEIYGGHNSFSSSFADDLNRMAKDCTF
jgi:hypothetical protein